VDAITLLKNDHKTVEQLFKRFEKSEDPSEKRKIADQVIRELSIHAAIEEQVFYPAIREAVPSEEDMVLESLEEHHVAKWVLSELVDMSPEAERFDAKFTVLMENVRHHVEEEEQELFPEVRKALGRKALAEVGAALEKAKVRAPRKPQPRMPDTPPGNIMSRTAAAALQEAKAGVKAKKSAKKAPARKKAAATRATAAKKAPARKAAKKATRKRA
jgi:hemerythrin superfamily protein